MDVVVVESPAKAKTINKYLGDNYVVLASYGHVRDLPSKDGSVRPDDDFAMDYIVDENSSKHMGAIAKAAKNADTLILATDPDREGEAISWHVMQALKSEYGIDHLPVQRVVFNEITKKAVQEGIANPRGLDMNMVNAQQARRALDYLVGFTLSPVLWRKLPGAKSAGRVQSVALRLVCERELEIDAFNPQEYWSITVDMKTVDGAKVLTRLTHLQTKKLEKFDLPNEATAMAAVEAIKSRSFTIGNVETKPTQRHPQPPFTTSTLQQEASRKLRFAARRTMQTAQRLYEGANIGGETVGLITYMRTDGVNMADEAVEAARETIAREFGDPYVPAQPRVYKTKSKNAQEAHEAIRPTDLSRSPKDVAAFLDVDQLKLYDLIWKRAMASQMASARLSRTTADIFSEDKQVTLRANGTVIDFPGFLKLYEEGKDDSGKEDDDDRRLPPLKAGDPMAQEKVNPAQHFTEPPPRYSEATLVKKLEELGIGRPSTYASILSVLQERSYVTLDGRRFIPEDKGLLVTAFLINYFKRYVEYDFTAELEDKLDEVSNGEIDWKAVLREFWQNFSAALDDTQELRVRDVFTAVDQALSTHLYGEDAEAARKCPSCEDGKINLKGGRFGFFLGCTNYPDCRYTRKMKQDGDENDAAFADGPIALGPDPESGQDITLRKGPYGIYMQIGEPDPEDKKKKPKRASLPKDIEMANLNLQMALRLLALPRDVGLHPEEQKMIKAGIGRYGPFLQMDGKYVSLTSTEEVLEIGLNLAVTKIAEAKEKGPGRNASREMKALGNHPEDGEPVQIMDGRFGPYVKHKKINATVPKGQDPETLTMEQAVALLIARAEKMGKKKPAKKKAAAKKKPAAKKTAAKKKPAAKKKAPAKKSTADAKTENVEADD